MWSLAPVPDALFTTRGAAGVAVGWMVVTLVIGLAASRFASVHLDGVVRTVEQDFSRSFWSGVGGQLALLPVMGLLVAALALSVVGAVVIPVAIVVFFLAAAGMGTLGFLATAQLTGGAFVAAATREALSARETAVRALLAGIVFYTGLWVAAGVLSALPVAGAVARGIAFAATWVAATAGFGAALWSRAGTRVPVRPSAQQPAPDDYAWVTPTPLTGVAAARRPPAHQSGADVSR